MVAFGDRKDFLQLLRMVHFRRKCTMRNNCKRDAEEAEPLPARGNAPCATIAKGMRKRQSLCRLEEMHHAQQLQKGCGRGRASACTGLLPPLFAKPCNAVRFTLKAIRSV